MRFTQQELSGIGLVAGVAIGASMLALPFQTGVAGFWNGCGLLTAAYLYSVATLLLCLEVTLYSKNPDTNFIGIAREHLGKIGESIVWVVYLLLLYAIATSYVSAGGQYLEDLFQGLGQTWLANESLCKCLYAVIVGLLSFQGVSLLDKINQAFLVGMFLSYCGLIGLVSPNAEFSNLAGGSNRFLLSGIPIATAAFACHFVIPTLRKNFSNNIPSLKKMIWFGASIPLLVYIVYEFLIIAVLPFSGDDGLLAIAASTSPLTKLQKALGQGGLSWMPFFSSTFSNCALMTSFLGVAISLYDFLLEGLKLNKTGSLITLRMAAMILGPPLFLSLVVPENSPAFTLFLDLSAFFVCFLFGILSVVMVWKSRYIQTLQSGGYQLSGGKPMLIMIFLISLGIMGLVLANIMDWVPTPRGDLITSIRST